MVCIPNSSTGCSRSRPRSKAATAIRLPANYPPEPGDTYGLSPIGFVFWSRDFLAAVAAPATAESIRLTRDYMVCRIQRRWVPSIFWGGRRKDQPVLAPTVCREPEEATRKQLACKLATRVQAFEYMTIVAVALTVCVSIYALSGRRILQNEQDMESTWAKIDAEVEALEDKIFKAANLPLAPEDHTSVSALCDMHEIDPAGNGSYRVADNAPTTTLPWQHQLPPRYVTAHQAHLCVERSRALLNLFVVTMHLQSWGSAVTQGLSKFYLPVAPLFGVMPSTLTHFAQEESGDGSLCKQIRPGLSNESIRKETCESFLWDEINRSRNVARSIPGSTTLYLLPVLYSFLGAMAATMRGLRRKDDSPLLSYTDRARIVQGAILGILCGGVIGLFATYIGKADAVGGLGISALALLAGYNVDGVLRFLDELSDRLFQPAPTAAPRRSS